MTPTDFDPDDLSDAGPFGRTHASQGDEPDPIGAGVPLHLLWEEAEPANAVAEAEAVPMRELFAPTPAPGPGAGLEERLDHVREVVRHTFGFPDLRSEQERAIRAALAGRDALVVLPTGGGKSLCYQAPALVRAGLTLVVSPLISLMKDQLDSLLANGVPAAMLASVQDMAEYRGVLSDLDQGRLKLLFVAPERLAVSGFVARLERAGLSLVAVDEAHCISHWGHDFRPDYRQIGELRRALPAVPVQAFTATATPRVREDIESALGLIDPVRVIGDFDRPNLTYRVLPRSGLADQVFGVVQRHQHEAGIVYCLRRKDTESLARDLAKRGVRCQPYHAGLEAGERRRVQESFQNEDLDVICATVAFGMGIDRPDVRFVVHASLPKGVEQYSQETGRAGRDGLPSECVLFYGGSDYAGWKSILERSAHEADVTGNLEARAELDSSYERLGHIWGLAGGATCRHRALVEYFGGEYTPPPEAAGEAGGCGACDVCLGELEGVADAGVIAQKILSCVVRCHQRYGAAHVSDVLRGADTARIRASGHDKLSTYGLLSEHDARSIRAWIEQLLALEHLSVSTGQYPTLQLTQSGLEVMRGEQEVSLFLPKRPARGKGTRKRTSSPADDVPELDDDGRALFEHLRGLRRRLAKERAVPPYVLFNDKTLIAMAASRPSNPAQFLALKGVGDKKAADLGPIFLGAIAEWLESRS